MRIAEGFSRVRAHRRGGGEGLLPQAPITVPFENVAVSVFRERIPESPAGRHARYRREVLTMPLRPLSAHRAVLALGSNLGESESTIERAVVDLREAGVHPAGLAAVPYRSGGWAGGSAGLRERRD